MLSGFVFPFCSFFFWSVDFCLRRLQSQCKHIISAADCCINVKMMDGYHLSLMCFLGSFFGAFFLCLLIAPSHFCIRRTDDFILKSSRQLQHRFWLLPDDSDTHIRIFHWHIGYSSTGNVNQNIVFIIITFSDYACCCIMCYLG